MNLEVEHEGELSNGLGSFGSCWGYHSVRHESTTIARAIGGLLQRLTDLVCHVARDRGRREALIATTVRVGDHLRIPPAVCFTLCL